MNFETMSYQELKEEEQAAIWLLKNCSSELILKETRQQLGKIRRLLKDME